VVAVYAQPVRNYRARSTVAIKALGVIYSTGWRPRLMPISGFAADQVAVALTAAGLS
jgi:hypothetical protein